MRSKSRALSFWSEYGSICTGFLIGAVLVVLIFALT